MHSFRPIFAFLLTTLPLAALEAREIEGVKVPETAKVSGQTLPLNGAGVRTITLAFIPIKAYVAAFYAPAPLRSAEAVMASPGPLRFTFTFLQGVGQGQVTDAWSAQFKASATATYPGFAADQAKFVAMFGPLAKFGVEAVEIAGDETRVFDDGALKGSIPGKDFQRAFLGLWFGSKPVMPSLKTALLGP